MKSKERSSLRTPRKRKRFADEGEEIRYLYERIMFWFFQRGRRDIISNDAKRLGVLLHRYRHMRGTIQYNSAMALLAEVKKDWDVAIRARRREIVLIRRLQALAPHEHRDVRRLIQHEYGPADLASRYDLLAIVLWKAGRLRAALNALRDSERVCAAADIPFDGADLRREISADLGSLRRRAA